MDLVSKIKNLATLFRDTIERCPVEQRSLRLQEFPRGSCGDVTLLLGTFLTENDCGVFSYMSGERGRYDAHANDWTSHAWLEQEGLIVDITADQFPEITEKVIVTTSSSWHQTFRTESLHAADFRIYDEVTKSSLETDYKAILESMEPTA